MFHLYACSRLFTTSAMHCDNSQQVRTRCCERSFVNTPRRTTIHNYSQLFPTNALRTTVRNQCEHANAHDCCERSFVNTPMRTTVPNQFTTTVHNCAQLFPTNVNTPMRTTVPNQCEHANAHNTTIHNVHCSQRCEHANAHNRYSQLFTTTVHNSQLSVNQPLDVHHIFHMFIIIVLLTLLLRSISTRQKKSRHATFCEHTHA